MERRAVVTGAGGRLGSALVRAFADAGWKPSGWARGDFDLDAPGNLPAIHHDVGLVVHAAAWTDVDACAREPELAMRRNSEATGVLARACAAAGARLILVSTNEVFDGTRTDGLGYRPDDTPHPPNPYGESKLAGERLAAGELDPHALAIVRTAWLFGPGKPDFPAKIAAAGRTARAERRPLRLVADEHGTPTHVPDLAKAVVQVAGEQLAGIHHVINRGVTSRAGWAREVFTQLGMDVDIEEVGLAEFPRASTPPRWGVLEPTPLPGGPLRDWRDAMVVRAAELRESVA